MIYKLTQLTYLHRKHVQKFLITVFSCHLFPFYICRCEEFLDLSFLSYLEILYLRQSFHLNFIFVFIILHVWCSSNFDILCTIFNLHLHMHNNEIKFYHIGDHVCQRLSTFALFIFVGMAHTVKSRTGAYLSVARLS